MLQVGLEDGGPCHRGNFQPRIWFGCSIYLPWGSPKLGQVCTWEGNVSSCQLGDDAVTQKPRASVGKTRPRTPAGVWFGAGSRDVSCRFILINLISGQRSALTTGQGDILRLFTEHLLCRGCASI